MTIGDFMALEKVVTTDGNYEYKVFVDDSEFSNMDINLISHNIYFEKSEDENLKIEYYESERDKVEIKIENDTLKIKAKVIQDWRFFNFKFKTRKVSNIKIYLPKENFNDVFITDRKSVV